MEEAKTSMDEPFVCELCDEKFDRVSDFNKHALIHTGETTFSCPLCDRIFFSELVQKRHTSTHREIEKPYACDQCDKRYSTKSVLISHASKAHRRSPMHPCLHCERSFPTQDQLRDHMNVHAGLKPYQCDHCDKAFSTKVRLFVISVFCRFGLVWFIPL